MARAGLSGSEPGADLSAWLAKMTAWLYGSPAPSWTICITTYWEPLFNSGPGQYWYTILFLKHKIYKLTSGFWTSCPFENSISTLPVEKSLHTSKMHLHSGSGCGSMHKSVLVFALFYWSTYWDWTQHKHQPPVPCRTSISLRPTVKFNCLWNPDNPTASIYFRLGGAMCTYADMHQFAHMNGSWGVPVLFGIRSLCRIWSFLQDYGIQLALSIQIT